ncbi:MAG: hypothetical protein LRY54_04240 [Alphaproteobacteria bacterium]|nr:hypothetical protein [Alphaproteobacteria bacterium]
MKYLQRLLGLFVTLFTLGVVLAGGLVFGAFMNSNSPALYLNHWNLK